MLRTSAFMKRTPLAAMVLGATAMVASAFPAVAQNVSNEAWLGQVGGQNVLDILQQGRGNSAGADNVYLLLGQDGVGNTLTLEQTGYDNKLGTLFADQPVYARGVRQRGDLNQIVIEQINSAFGGSNMVGSVQQRSRLNLSPASTAFNSLTVSQTADGGVTGIAAHYIGRIVQVNLVENGDTNVVKVTQTGGGDQAGNILANLRQIGSANRFTLVQDGELNRIGEIPPAGELPTGGVVQVGTGNVADVSQSGLGNLLQYSTQRGTSNLADVTMSGDLNVIAEIRQDNEILGAAVAGNRIDVAITGDSNGGDFGVVGDMLLPAVVGMGGVLPSLLQQLGDDNDLNLVIVDGVDNRFGTSQFGDGNDIHIAMSAQTPGGDATGNESAVFQYGNVNYVRHIVVGNGNAGAVSQFGDRNRLQVFQTGDDNVAEVRVTGDNNNGHGSALFGPALALGLPAGELTQVGIGHIAEVEVLGSNNAFALSQSGSTNAIRAEITGGFNALAVMQTGTSHTSLSVQSGTNNALAVRQF